MKDEVLETQFVDFKKYADIIINLQMRCDYYGMIKHFDNETLDTLVSRFDTETAMAMTESIIRFLDTAAQY